LDLYLAEELGSTFFYAGPITPQKPFGVKALSAEICGRFDIPWTFIDHPTGL